MFAKIKNLYKNPFWQQFKDVRAIGLAAFAVIAILVTWSAGKAIQTNYDLQKQIAKLASQNELQQLTNENLRLRNQYFKTDRFLELAARRQFGKAAPGEVVLNVPTNIALSHIADLPEPASAKKPKAAKKPAYQRNFQQWVNFFFHRGSDAE